MHFYLRLHSENKITSNQLHTCRLEEVKYMFEQIVLVKALMLTKNNSLGAPSYCI